jgi:aspartate/methionine/tyrosine aminotransferase
LNPYNGWRPDISELEQKVKENSSISGILVINPDNPTGFVYPPDILQDIVRVAKKYDLFLIFDETYINLIYNGQQTVPLSDIVEDVPGMSMKGISKEFPWPGARCGWLEIYNGNKDEAFSKYTNAILNQKMSEVCSTTLPQMSIPVLMEHPQYPEYLKDRIRNYENLSNIAYDLLKDVPYVTVNRTNGAFYISVVFNQGVLNNRQTLPIEHSKVEGYITEIVDKNIENDKRFVYYLLGSTGICVVPLTSFFTSLQGFRITLLEKDQAKFKETVKGIAESIVRYIESHK